MLKKIYLYLCSSLMLIFIIGAFFLQSEEVQAKAITYTISPTTKPINKAYLKYKGYNSSTKHYYLLDSYLKKIESNGGGTLVLKKGTYTVSNVLYIPSNTTIKLQNGATLKKGTSTGKASFNASKTLFQFVTSKKANAYESIKKYNGSKNITIQGTGKAIIDLNNASKSPAIVMAHAQNVTIKGIQFQKNNQASIVHVIGSKNVTLTNNKFLNAKAGTNLATIRLESATDSSAVYYLHWNNPDSTVNQKVSIKSNTFENQYAAIKTTAMEDGKYQREIVIAQNIFKKMQHNSIYMTAWNKPQIYKNTFNDELNKAKETIVIRATQYPVVKANDFKHSKTILTFKNVADSVIENKLSASNKKDLATNQGTGVSNYSIKLSKDEQVAFLSLDPILEPVRDFEFDKNTVPLNKSYEKRATYAETTKSYYALRSILERLETLGGGTLVIKKGDYTITNNLYVPSNVTIELEDGVILRKALASGVDGLTASASLFQLVPPSKADGSDKVGGFNGTKNVKIYSKGRATIDLQGVKPSFAIVIGHNENITIQNIDFINVNGGHFLEIDAAKNVLVDNATFTNNLVASNSSANEAINLDTPDALTKGFNVKWSNMDRTGNENITIQNSIFQNMVCSIGTHQMSGEAEINGIKYTSEPHKDVKIINNTFIDSRSEAIHMMNWEKPVIKNNKFLNNGILNSEKNGIVSKGAHYPTIQNNHFEAMGVPIKFATGQNGNNAKEYAKVYNLFTETNLKDLATNTGTNLLSYSISISGTNQTNLKTKLISIINKGV